MSRHVIMRRTVVRLGRQVARALCRSGKKRAFWEPTAGDTFAQLFPDLVGRELVIDNKGVELAGNPRRLLAFLWLQQNGYV